MFVNTGDNVQPTPADRCSLFTITKPWNSKEVTWLNATKDVRWTDLDLNTKNYDEGLKDTLQFPGGGDHSKNPVAVSDPAPDTSWENYKITNTMKDIINNNKPFYGFYAKAWFTNTSRYYRSSEYMEDSTTRPKLVIKYVGLGIVAQNGKSNSKWNILVNRSGNNVNIFISCSGKYTFSVSDLKGRTLVSQNGATQKWYSIPSVNIPAGIAIITVSHGNLIAAKRFIHVQ